MVATIEAIWARVKSYEGAEFNTKTGKPFKYDVVGNSIRPQHTERIISKVNFEKVLDHLPMDGPGEISKLVQGSAYVWAILHDPRIRHDEW
jgi:hypothetical protein